MSKSKVSAIGKGIIAKIRRQLIPKIAGMTPAEQGACLGILDAIDIGTILEDEVRRLFGRNGQPSTTAASDGKLGSNDGIGSPGEGTEDSGSRGRFDVVELLKASDES